MRIPITFTLIIIISIISIYFFGTEVRRNTTINSRLTRIEHGYKKLNEQLVKLEIKQTLIKTKTFMKWVSIASLIILVISIKTLHTESALIRLVLTITLFSASQWFSISWCLMHKKTLKKISKDVILFCTWPLVLWTLGLLDKSIYEYLGVAMLRIAEPLEFLLPTFLSNSLLGISLGITLIMILMAIAFYATIWAMAMPIFISCLLLIAFPIKLARLVKVFNPVKPFAGLLVFIYTLSSIAIAYLSIHK